MPRKVFVAGEILTASEVNTNLMDQSVMVFDDATARTTAIPTPVEGMVTYLKDEDEVTVFDGSAFKAVGPGKILQVVFSETTTTTTTTSGTPEDTSLDATITPSSASNKILIHYTLSNIRTFSGANAVNITLFRGDTSGTQLGNLRFSEARITVSEELRVPAAGVFLDSPSTTSATTYTVGISSNTAGATSQVKHQQSMILMEVAG